MKWGQLRALRSVGVALAAVGGAAALLGAAGVVATNVKFAGIKCPGDASCIDQMMGRGIYGTLGVVGVCTAAVGGLIVWRVAAAIRRKTSWSR